MKWGRVGKIGWRWIGLGPAVTAIGWSAGTFAFGFYFSSTIASGYHLAGSSVAPLIWMCLMAQIMLAGARLAYEHARRDAACSLATPRFTQLSHG